MLTEVYDFKVPARDQLCNTNLNFNFSESATSQESTICNSNDHNPTCFVATRVRNAIVTILNVIG